MQAQLLHASPDIWLLTDFVTDAESAHLLQLAAPRFQRSKVHCEEGNCVDEARTSESAFLPSDEVTRQIQQRGLQVANLKRAEDLQVVRYGVGQKYDPHLDAFDRAVEDGQKVICAAGGRRAATILVYLNVPQSGGETAFPNLGLKVKPVKNAGVYWRNLDATGVANELTRHAGMPVGSGMKYALNVWLLEPEPNVDCSKFAMPAPWRKPL